MRLFFKSFFYSCIYFDQLRRGYVIYILVKILVDEILDNQFDGFLESDHNALYNTMYEVK